MRRKAAGVLCALGTVLLTAGAVAAGPAGAATEEERIPAIGPSTVATEACTASFPATASHTFTPSDRFRTVEKPSSMMARGIVDTWRL